MNLHDIPVQVLDRSTGMATAVLTDLASHLASLAETGQSSSIDLVSLPMTDTDINELADHLGVGEVSASINGIGSSKIRETAYRGIWWITHYGDDGAVVSELIEITRIPEILVTHIDEIKHAAKAIAAL